MTVHIPGALQSYTKQSRTVTVEETTLSGILCSLDQRFPGLRFRIVDEQDRIRPHIRIFINERQTFHLTATLEPDDDVYIVCALSGG